MSEVATPGTELEPIQTGTDLEDFDAAAAALAADNQASADPGDFVIPILKLAQPLTAEVQDGDASAGDFVIAVTRESLGNEIDFVVSGYAKGRFRPGDPKKDIPVRAAFNQPIVPWPDDPFYGRPFAQHPEAEEVWAAKANAGEIEWGDGPPIRTTYNFTGHVIAADGEAEDEPFPVRLSLMRSNAPAARNWLTILDAVLRGRYWDSVFHLTSSKKDFAGGSSYVVNVKKTRATTPQERQRAVQLGLILKQQKARFVGDEEADDRRPAEEPDARGGADI